MLVVPSRLVMFGINKAASCSRCFGYARRHPATSSENFMHSLGFIHLA